MKIQVGEEQWREMLPAERLLITEAEDGHSFIDALNAWTVSTKDAGDWNQKRKYVKDLSDAAESLIASDRLLIRNGLWRQLSQIEALRAARIESSWWTPLDAEATSEEEMLYLDLPSDLIIDVPAQLRLGLGQRAVSTE